jgi:hypothetical protein
LMEGRQCRSGPVRARELPPVPAGSLCGWKLRLWTEEEHCGAVSGRASWWRVGRWKVLN